ncbi:unnamed protein product [Protopolystoma xenopodis]|uniref:Uncharacterized protein n=1 Tax=Protopolystoma xenopodis TaxID=117903 RepID=A0A3S5BSW0_9PLAT|nr:unnamed protein product [Protopolystoma xenopodis]
MDQILWRQSDPQQSSGCASDFMCACMRPFVFQRLCVACYYKLPPVFTVRITQHNPRSKSIWHAVTFRQFDLIDNLFKHIRRVYTIV